MCTLHVYKVPHKLANKGRSKVLDLPFRSSNFTIYEQKHIYICSDAALFHNGEVSAFDQDSRPRLKPKARRVVDDG